MDRPGIRGTALVLGVAVAVLTGCSAEDASETIQTIEPATPAVAPSVTPTPAGTVRPLDYRVDDLIVGETGTLAALADDGTRLLLLDDPAVEPQVVTLPAEAATLAAGPGDTILAPASGVVAQIDTSDGTVAEVPVDADAVSAAVLGDGRWAVGTSDGRVLIVDPGTGEVAETIGGLASADLIAVSGDSVAALDRRQTSLTSIDVEEAHLGAALRAGRGATQLTTDPYGRVLVTDTTGDELLVYTIDELILRQRYPVGPAPYAVAYDGQRDLVWVTLTGSNEVVGYDLSTGTAEERHRFATVRQPNSVAVDPADGTLVIASATGDGLQRIPIEG